MKKKSLLILMFLNNCRQCTDISTSFSFLCYTHQVRQAQLFAHSSCQAFCGHLSLGVWQPELGDSLSCVALWGRTQFSASEFLTSC